MFFFWKELITATKRVKGGERWGGRKGEKISRQSIKSYESSTILRTVKNLGTGVIISYKNTPLPTALENKAKTDKKVKVIFRVNLLLVNLLGKLTSSVIYSTPNPFS